MKCLTEQSSKCSGLFETLNQFLSRLSSQYLIILLDLPLHFQRRETGLLVTAYQEDRAFFFLLVKCLAGLVFIHLLHAWNALWEDPC